MTYKNYGLYKSLQKLKKDKKGASAIEMVIGMMAFILVLCFLLDLMMLSWKFYVISQSSSYVARTAGLQGGIHYTAPHGFPGGNTAYESASEMSNKIKEDFADAGIKSGEYTVRVNGYDITNGGTTPDIDYRKTIKTEITVDYRWDFIDNFYPGQITQTITSKRSAVSEFKYRYDSWVGE